MRFICRSSHWSLANLQTNLSLSTTHLCAHLSHSLQTNAPTAYTEDSSRVKYKLFSLMLAVVRFIRVMVEKELLAIEWVDDLHTHFGTYISYTNILLEDVQKLHLEGSPANKFCLRTGSRGSRVDISILVRCIPS